MLQLDSQFEQPDEAYRMMIEAHRGLNIAESAALNAALVLILANHIGEISVLKEAIAVAREN